MHNIVDQTEPDGSCGSHPVSKKGTSVQHITFLLAEAFSHLAFSCAVEPLVLANNVSSQSLYSWSFGSLNGRNATSYSRVTVQTDHSFTDIPRSDFVFLLAGDIGDGTFPKPLLAALRRLRVQGCTLGALGTGVFGLAQAGLLADQRISLHWEMQDSFRELYPELQVCDDVFSTDGGVATAAGGSAAGDYILHMIRQRHGEELSLAVADRMVLAAPREASAPQTMSFQSKKGVRNRHLFRAVELMRENLEDPMTPSEIARTIGISTRQLERIFKSRIGKSPKQYYVEMRLQRARRLLTQTEDTVTNVALACGFTGSSHFSRLYKSRFGCSPRTQRGWLT